MAGLRRREVPGAEEHVARIEIRWQPSASVGELDAMENYMRSLTYMVCKELVRSQLNGLKVDFTMEAAG